MKRSDKKSRYDAQSQTYKVTKPETRLVVDSYGVCHFLPIDKSRYEVIKELRESYSN